MKKIFAIILAVVVMTSLLGCSKGADGRILATIQTNSGERKQMTLQELQDIEETNSILFEDEYIGADITVTSTVKKIGGAYRLTSWFDCDAYIELDAGSNIGCFFKPVTEEYAKALNVGDIVTVSGKIGMASVSGFDIYIMKDAISPY